MRDGWSGNVRHVIVGNARPRRAGPNVVRSGLRRSGRGGGQRGHGAQRVGLLPGAAGGREGVEGRALRRGADEHRHAQPAPARRGSARRPMRGSPASTSMPDCSISTTFRRAIPMGSTTRRRRRPTTTRRTRSNVSAVCSVDPGARARILVELKRLAARPAARLRDRRGLRLRFVRAARGARGSDIDLLVVGGASPGASSTDRGSAAAHDAARRTDRRQRGDVQQALPGGPSPVRGHRQRGPATVLNLGRRKPIELNPFRSWRLHCRSCRRRR